MQSQNIVHTLSVRIVFMRNFFGVDNNFDRNEPRWGGADTAERCTTSRVGLTPWQKL